MSNRIFIYTRRLLILFICLLFLLFLSVELYQVNFFLSANLLKLLTIFICLIISIISSPLSRQSRSTFLLQLGLIFTFMADYIFLIHDNDYSIAIGIFSIVQMIYSLRYRGEGNDGKRILRFALIYLLIISTNILLQQVGIRIDFIYIMGFFYSITLIASLVEAGKLYKREPNRRSSRLILSGMVFFFLCDLSLAISYILNQVDMTSSILHLLKDISSISIWIYYLPSQLLLALSGGDLRLGKVFLS